MCRHLFLRAAAAAYSSRVSVSAYRLGVSRERLCESKRTFNSNMSYWIPLPDVITGPRPSDLPTYFAVTALLWVLILQLCPKTKGECYLSIAHSVIVTYSSLACIFRGDDTAFSCAASVSFFVVDAIDMYFKDVAKAKEEGRALLTAMPMSRKMDYLHHVLGVTFGLVEHYYENDLCPAHVGCAFIYVQWNEVSTPFYNLFRLTGSQVWGACFALSFFLARVVANTVIIIPLLYGNCSSLLGVFCVPYFLLQYLWFYMIVLKIRRSLSKQTKAEVEKGKKAELKKPFTKSFGDIKTD